MLLPGLYKNQHNLEGFCALSILKSGTRECDGMKGKEFQIDPLV